MPDDTPEAPSERMLDSLAGYTVADHRRLTEALRGREREMYDLGEDYRSPAIERWLEGLEPAKDDDEERLEKYSDKARWTTWRLEPDGTQARNYTEDFTEADEREAIEISNRLRNDYLRQNLPMQVADLVSNGVELIGNLSEDWEREGQLRKVIKDGDLRAVAKGLEIQRNYFEREVQRFTGRHEPPIGIKNDPYWHPKTSHFERKSWAEYNERRQRKIDGTLDALSKNGFIQGSGAYHLKLPTWSEILKDPQAPPQSQQPSPQENT